jgi:hypothetical protein
MATQLLLLDSTSPSWKLDRRTREIGRRGVAEAREALRRAGGGGGNGDGNGRTKAA